LPKQNRPLVRDGRIQTKKRTDRSYLKPAATPAPAPAPMSDAEVEAAEAGGEPDAVAEAIVETAPSAPASATGGRLPSRVRAMQQQGVRKRGVDLQALAINDTQYAIHELRRIAVLAVMVVITLIVLAIVMR
jgi:hypothetical protein